MKNINVYLRLGSHPLYQYLVNYPPRGVKYKISSLTTVKDVGLIRRLKKFAWNQFTKFRPPAFLLNPRNSDLIHSTYGSLILNKKPWVVDVEHGAAFAKYHVASLRNPNYRNKIKNILESDFCKKIMPWTFAAKKSVEAYFKTKKIKDKMEVVYPAIKLNINKIKKNYDEIRILIVSRFFYEKGGKQALDVYDILKKKYDLKMIVVSNAPQDIKKKYANENVEFIYPNLTIEQLSKNYYSKSDIFLHLTFADTLGAVLLEAMQHELPIIGTDMFSMPEIIEDGKNGFLVHSNFSVLDKNFYVRYYPELGNWNKFLNKVKKTNLNLVRKACEKTSELIENSSLRKKMGKNGRKMVEKGKFSIDKRNKKLRRIYEEVLKEKT